ncbi:hypothetical protein G3N64_19100 [Burkholderia sp. Ac-20344]|nr:hypothetical protein [Burkholderia sp. Ac-20344]
MDETDRKVTVYGACAASRAHRFAVPADRGRRHECRGIGHRQARKLPCQQAGQPCMRQTEQPEFAAARACRNERAEQACIGCVGVGRCGQQRLQRALSNVIERGCHRVHRPDSRTARSA